MSKSYDIERTSQGFDIEEADVEIERLRAAIETALGQLADALTTSATHTLATALIQRKEDRT